MQGESCRLVSGRFAAIVQFLLMLAALSTLVVKRRMEVPRRDFKVWLLDSGKQCVGGLWIHFCNLGVSVLFAHVLGQQHGVDSQNECAFYFFNFLVDTFIGVAFVYLLLRVVHHVALQLNWQALLRSGEYGDPPQMHVWLLQTGVFVVVLTLAKVAVAALLFENRVHLARLGDVLFAPFETHPKAELVCVMVIGPGLMNAFQFWMQDSFLKRGHETDVAKSHISPRVGSGTSLATAAEQQPLGAEFEMSSNIRAGGRGAPNGKYKYSDDWSAAEPAFADNADRASSPGQEIDL